MKQHEETIREPSITEDQQRMIDLCDGGANACILGAAGTGKSTALTTLIKKFRQQRLNVLVVSFTGIAAELVGGCTINSAFNIAPGPALTGKRKQIVAHAPAMIQAADVIIVDEISMVRMDYFDAISLSIQKANAKRRELREPNIQLIVTGDFFQLPPVVTPDDRLVLEEYYGRDIKNAYAFMSDTWKSWHFKYMELTEIVRQTDWDFSYHLNLLRMGDSSCIDYFNKAVGPFFPDAISLYPYREDVQKENFFRLCNDKSLSGEEVCFQAKYTNDAEPEDFPRVDSLLPLRVGAPVMILTNHVQKECEDIGAKLGLYLHAQCSENLYSNGDVGVVVDVYQGEKLEDAYVYIKVNGRILSISPHRFQVYETIIGKDGKYTEKCKGSCIQFPLSLGFCSTIHKFQGKTVDRINIDPDCFAPGQLYVALSRCRSLEGIRLNRLLTEDDIIVDSDVMQFYREISKYINRDD